MRALSVEAQRMGLHGALAIARHNLGLVAAAREGVAVLESSGQVEDGESPVRRAYAEALRAAGRAAEFATAIRSARDSLLARAAKISDLGRRERLSAAVPDNARTMAPAKGALEGARR